MHRTILRLLAASSLLAALATGPALAPVAAGGGCHAIQEGLAEGTATGHTEGTATVVRMDVCAFGPTVVHVPTGTEVRFLNTANQDHMVVGESRVWGSDDVLAPGDSIQQQFTEPGVFPYSCPLHAGMVGAVVVGEATAGGGTGPAGAPAPVGGTTGDGQAPTNAEVAPAATGAVPAGLVGAALATAIIGLLAVGGLLLARLRPGRPVATKER